MSGYHHNSILVNGRVVKLKAILDETAPPETEFESSSFSFIRNWLTPSISSFLFHTSGSTGAPRETTFTREQMAASAGATIHALKISSFGTSLVCLHTKYVAGKMMLVRSFINQMKIILKEPTSNPLADLDPNTAVDFIALVPVQLQTILEQKLASRLNKIKTIIVGGAAVSDQLDRMVSLQIDTNIFETYGMTETLSHIALRRINYPGDKAFEVLPGVKISADDRNCLVIETAFLSGKIVTNDIVELLSPRSFRWLGRWDNTINSGGIKIIPEVMEQRIAVIFNRLNIERRFFIGALHDDRYGEKVTLFIEGEPLGAEKSEALNAEIFNTFLTAEKPARITFADRFFETFNGKINRRETIRHCNS
jgi:O-succinylbenzoic acid--CoA ligase